MSWLKQNQKPLSQEILWGVAQRRDQAAKVLVIGGNRESIRAPLAMHLALVANCKQVSVALPDVLKKQLKGMENLIFCPSNQSGSFSNEGLEMLQKAADDHDCLLLAGDMTHNSQTLLLIDEMIETSQSPIVASGDVAEWLLRQPQHYQKVVIVSDPSKLKGCLDPNGKEMIYKPDLNIHLFAQVLEGLPEPLQLISWHANNLWVKVGKDVVSSPSTGADYDDQQQVADLISRVILYLSQNPSQPLAALASAIYPKED